MKLSGTYCTVARDGLRMVYTDREQTSVGARGESGSARELAVETRDDPGKACCGGAERGAIRRTSKHGYSGVGRDKVGGRKILRRGVIQASDFGFAFILGCSMWRSV